MKTETLQTIKEQTKQNITKAILDNRFNDAKNIINSAIEYKNMIGKEVISAIEISEFNQAILEAELSES